MARLWYGGAPADYTVALSGSYLTPAASVTLQVWDARTGGSQVTDLLDESGSAITVVTSNGSADIRPFQGPNGYEKPLWVAVAGGPYRYRMDPSNENIWTRLATLEGAGAGTLNGLSDVDTSGSSAGKALVDGGSGVWVPGSVSSTLAGLTDVNLTGRQDGYAVTWDNANSRYKHTAMTVTGDYAATGHTHSGMLRGYVIESGGSNPVGIQSGDLIFELAAANWGYGALVGTGTSSSSTTLTFQPNATIAVGTLLVLGIGWGPTDSTITVADTGSNTWTQAAAQPLTGGATKCSLYYCKVTTQLTTASTVTVTFSTSTTNGAAACASVIGSHATPLDKTATAGNAGSTAVSVGPTATLTTSPQAGLAVVAFNPQSRTFSVGSGWTQGASASNGNRAVSLLYRIQSDTTAMTATGTLSASGAWAAALGTFKKA